MMQQQGMQQQMQPYSQSAPAPSPIPDNQYQTPGQLYNPQTGSAELQTIVGGGNNGRSRDKRNLNASPKTFRTLFVTDRS
jgi:hypothetical protein